MAAKRYSSGQSSASSSQQDVMNETASTIKLETVSGSHQLNIIGYSLTKGIGIGNFFTSDTFNIGGYDWKILYYPDGSEIDQKCPHISLYLKLHSPDDETDVRAMFNICLEDHYDAFSQPKIKLNPPKTFNREKSRWGYPYFMKRDELEASEYLKDDCFRIKCVIDVVKYSINKVHYNYNNNRTCELEFPASNLAEHFGKLLRNKEGTDVTFEVQGENFTAHRCILAARSPVFKAELLGSMSERNIQCIKIHDMEPVTFQELLHFVYTDSLSASFELVNVESTLMAQHLLVAADRYALGKLKLICEDKLCQTIFIDTVATTLALAEQHNCRKLKSVCLKFIEIPENLLRMMLTDGFEHLKINCPTVLNEIRDKLPESTVLRGVLAKLSVYSISN